MVIDTVKRLWNLRGIYGEFCGNPWSYSILSKASVNLCLNYKEILVENPVPQC